MNAGNGRDDDLGGRPPGWGGATEPIPGDPPPAERDAESGEPTPIVAEGLVAGGSGAEESSRSRWCDNLGSCDGFDGCDGCDIGGCDGCDCNLLLRLSTLLHLAAALVPRHHGRGVVLAVLGFYRRRLTRFTPRCPSTPHCSAYAVTAVQTLGPRRGLAAAARRVRDCGRPG